MAQAANGLADRAARRAAAARLVDRYAPALLASPQHSVDVPAGSERSVRLRLRRGAGPGGVDPALFASLEPVERYAVTGVPAFHRSPGEGAPLVGTLRPLQPVSRAGGGAQPVAGIAWAVTAVPVLEASPAGAGGPRTVTLDLYDPHNAERIPRPGGGSVPLAADYTTPLAVTVGRFRPERRGLLGFLRGSEYFRAAGLFPQQAPTSSKVPLVFVHGLLSDPSDFYYLYDAINADPAMRRRYQVWSFYYPSSLPVPYSALLLREDLVRLTRQLDPAGTRPAVHRLALVGHSMGGLLCRLAVSDGGDGYYRHFFRQPLEALRLAPTQRDLVQRAFFYRADPDVAQVVFIATPHRGSALASGLLGRVGRLLVRLPAAASTRLTAIFTANPSARVAGAPLKPASSIDSLSPRDPVVAAINEMPMCAGVGLHSILGDRGRPGPAERSSDGVVPYTSAHLPQASSERLVPASHTGTLHRPETAAEIIRVLQAAGSTRS